MRSPLLVTLLALSLLVSTVGVHAADTPEAATATAKPSIEAGIDLAADGPLFTYITGKTYKLTVKLENKSKDEVKLDKVDITWKAAKNLAVDVKPDGNSPTSLAPNASGSAAFSIVFPEQAAGQQVDLCANIKCGDKVVNAESSILVSPPFEITLLPGRLILDPNQGPKSVGMSVINHTEAPFDGKITLTCYPGIEVKPSQVDAKIDPLGLEAYVLTVSPSGSPAPGHYAVFVDVGGKAKDWVAVDVPVVVRKLGGGIKIQSKIEGNTDSHMKDWKENAAAVRIGRSSSTEGKASYEYIGWAKLSYDDRNFYLSVETDDSAHKPTSDSVVIPQGYSIKVGFDPLIDGAKGPAGGYKEDDLEYTFTSNTQRLVATRTDASGVTPEAAAGSWHDRGKIGCEIVFPWNELKVKPEKSKMFAISILVNDSDGSNVTQYEFGGGIAGNPDPRKFVPVVLAD